MAGSHTDQFAAALAHQIKSPSAALQAAAVNLRRNLCGLLEDLASLGREAGPAGREPMTRTSRFVSRVVFDPAPAPLTGLLPEDRIDAIARRLDAAGVSGDLREAAACLARGGWDTYMEEIAPLLRHDRALVLDILAHTARLRSNLGSIESALERIRGLGSALRLMSRPTQASMIEIAPGLEATIALFRESLPEGVRLVSRIEPMPRTMGRADLLNEVWTNLIANAVQSVGDSGTIRVEGSRAARDGCASICVVDDGPGIPADALPRVFEPFFTTRSAEGGTGLGLALARQIVETFGGALTVDSRAGRTCFTVLLPAASAVQAES